MHRHRADRHRSDDRIVLQHRLLELLLSFHGLLGRLEPALIICDDVKSHRLCQELLVDGIVVPQ